MFGIGAQEFAIILVIALLIFGPKRLPELARTMGRGLAEFRRASSDLRQSINLEADDSPPRDFQPPPPNPAVPDHPVPATAPPPAEEPTAEADEPGAEADAETGAETAADAQDDEKRRLIGTTPEQERTEPEERSGG